jgi:hypothetical protein
MAEMNQLGLQHIYTWKCHKEVPVYLTQEKSHFFFLQNWRTGEQNRSWGVGVGINGKGVGCGIRV